MILGIDIRDGTILGAGRGLGRKRNGTRNRKGIVKLSRKDL